MDKYFYDNCIFSFKEAFAINFAETLRYNNSNASIKEKLYAAISIGPKTAAIVQIVVESEFPQYKDILYNMMLLL